MGRFMSSGIAWEGPKSRKLVILVIALCLAIMLVVTLAPTAQAGDTAAAANSGSETVAFGYPTYSGGFDWSPAGSYSMRGVSWS